MISELYMLDFMSGILIIQSQILVFVLDSRAMALPSEAQADLVSQVCKYWLTSADFVPWHGFDRNVFYKSWLFVWTPLCVEPILRWGWLRVPW